VGEPLTRNVRQVLLKKRDTSWSKMSLRFYSSPASARFVGRWCSVRQRAENLTNLVIISGVLPNKGREDWDAMMLAGYLIGAMVFSLITLVFIGVGIYHMAAR
jgi:hypothetical protein